VKIGPAYLEIFDKIRRPCEHAETTGPIFTKILHVIVAFVMLLYFAYTRHYPIPFPNSIAIKVIGPEKTSIVRLSLVAMATSLEKSKKLNEVSKPLQPSTNSEILVKIAPLASELRRLECERVRQMRK